MRRRVFIKSNEKRGEKKGRMLLKRVQKYLMTLSLFCILCLTAGCHKGVDAAVDGSTEAATSEETTISEEATASPETSEPQVTKTPEKTTEPKATKTPEKRRNRIALQRMLQRQMR